MGSQVVLELTRDGPPGDEAQPRDETWYTLRRKDGSSAKARFPWSRVLPDLQAAALWSTPGAEARLRVGEAVRVFLQQLGWSREEAEILDALKEGGGAADVHVTIRSATELCRLPMEVLPLGASGEALGRKKGCHVQWEWPGASMAPRVLPAPPEGGALLFAWSTAGGVLDAPSQLRAIQEATRTHRHPTRPELLPGASLERLQQALDSIRARGQSVAVLHLLCHGAPLPGDGGGFGLALDAQGGGTVTVDPASCADALAPYAGLVGCVVLCACHGANLVDAPGVLGSVAQRLHRAGFPAVVASRVPLSSAGAESFTEAFHGALLAGEPFHRAVAAGRRRLGTEWAALQVYGWEAATPLYPVVFRPYRGLRSFETSDRRFFFGRKALTEQLRARVIEALDGGKPRFQLVAGTSGSGKSSLVKAGLIPSLPEAWRHAVLRPGGDGAIRETGMGRLLRALADVQGAPAGHGGEVSEEAVIAQARRFREKWPGSPLLLVVDQLEEAFRLEGDEPRRFLGCLWRLAKDEPLKIVVLSTFRADLLEPAQGMVLEGDLTLQNVVYREAHRLYVESMSSTELLDAIRRPLDEVGLTFESGIAEQLRDEAGKEPGALPLLEHALDALWQERRDRVLTRKAYEHLGGLSGALSRQLDGLWDTLPAAQQRQGQRLLVALTDVAEDVALSTRRRERVEKLRPKGGASAAAFDAVLEGLVARRLLVRGQLEDLGASSRGGWVEVAHEALIRRWTRLQSWLHKDRAEAAWAKRWLRRAVIAMAIAGALVVFQLVLLGVTRFREAKHERDEAISRELTLRVTATLESGDPQLNLALLRKAGDLAATEQLVSALALWEASPGRVVMQGHQTRVKVARFFPGGLRILTAGDDATARIWSADTGKPVAVLTGHVDSVLAAGLSPDSRRVLTASADQTARIWDAATGELIAVLSGHSAPVLAADFSPDGLRVLTASADRTARVWDSTTGRSLGVLSGHGRPVLAASFSPDGLRVLTASAD
ncbi:MAG TPA: CHAT domain-containing protein, partial [Myxococcales bacterium]|nr:CHAT domain-containing protein [Myxococcales bacterium]